MSSDFKRENFALIKKLLSQGEVMILPSDTIYGLSADPSQKKAIKALQKIKKRDEQKPFLLLVAGLEQMTELVELSDFAGDLIRKITPAPITFILPRRAGALSDFFPAQEKLALRLPNYPLLLDFLKNVWCQPLISTSVNESGQSPEHHLANLKKLGLPLFAKQKTSAEKSSTIIQIEGEQITVLRDERLLKNKILKLAKEILDGKKDSFRA